jgi:DNA invertase Pin-like site-specific DNA recombinase
MSNNAPAKKTSFGVPEQKGNVTIYPAVSAEILRTARGHKIRVAAYVRVSTDSIGQEGSLILQKEYYENYITSKPEYEFVGIYEDDGITATSVEKRKGFLKLMEDCQSGKIDLVFTKSISRFARNTGDLLYYVNMLNALNPPVEIWFETDRISTFGTSGEIIITLLGLFAQEESRSKSEAITWAVDNLFAQGKYYAFPILGYDKEKGRDNPLMINEEEAKTVRLCYALTIRG